MVQEQSVRLPSPALLPQARYLPRRPPGSRSRHRFWCRSQSLAVDCTCGCPATASGTRWTTVRERWLRHGSRLPLPQSGGAEIPRRPTSSLDGQGRLRMSDQLHRFGIRVKDARYVSKNSLHSNARNTSLGLPL